MRRKLWKKILFETSAQPQQNIGMSRHFRKQTIRIARNIAMGSYMLSVSQSWNHHFPVGKEIHARPLSWNDCHPWPLKVHHSYCVAFLSGRKKKKTREEKISWLVMRRKNKENVQYWRFSNTLFVATFSSSWLVFVKSEQLAPICKASRHTLSSFNAWTLSKILPGHPGGLIQFLKRTARLKGFSQHNPIRRSWSVARHKVLNFVGRRRGSSLKCQVQSLRSWQRSFYERPCQRHLRILDRSAR